MEPEAYEGYLDLRRFGKELLRGVPGVDGVFAMQGRCRILDSVWGLKGSFSLRQEWLTSRMSYPSHVSMAMPLSENTGFALDLQKKGAWCRNVMPNYWNLPRTSLP